MRYLFLDFTRGFAVILMIIFHFLYDLNYFKFVKLDFFNGTWLYYFPKLIVFLFLISVGMSLELIHGDGVKWDKIKKRSLRLGGIALIISLVTYFLFPKNWIFFGIIHCIFVSTLLGTLFVGKPKLSVILGGLIIVVHLTLTAIYTKYTLIPIGKWINVRAMDYIPFYPWFSCVLLGIYLKSINVHQLSLGQSRPVKAVAWLGKHSLTIYLTHQVVMFSIFYLVYKLISTYNK